MKLCEIELGNYGIKSTLTVMSTEYGIELLNHYIEHLKLI